MFESRIRLVVFGFAFWLLVAMPGRLNGAQYYTNWTAAHFSANPAP